MAWQKLVRVAVVAATWAVAAGLPLPLAVAESNRDRARALLREGNKHFNLKEYAAALEKFIEARRLYPSHRVDVNLGMTYLALDDLPHAATHFEIFLVHESREQEAEKMEAIQQKLDEIKDKLGTVTISCSTAGATVILDSEPLGQTPVSHRLYVAPGTHWLTVEKGGHTSFTRSLSLKAGESLSVEVPLEVLAPRPKSSPPATGGGLPALHRDQRPAGPAPRPVYKRAWFWAVVSAAVVGVVTTAVLATQLGGSDRLPSGEAGSITLE